MINGDQHARNLAAAIAAGEKPKGDCASCIDVQCKFNVTSEALLENPTGDAPQVAQYTCKNTDNDPSIPADLDYGKLIRVGTEFATQGTFAPLRFFKVIWDDSGRQEIIKGFGETRDGAIHNALFSSNAGSYAPMSIGAIEELTEAEAKEFEANQLAEKRRKMAWMSTTSAAIVGTDN
jgi:hypothetical protein